MLNLQFQTAVQILQLYQPYYCHVFQHGSELWLFILFRSMRVIDFFPVVFKEFYITHENFFYSFDVRSANFYLCSIPMAIEQWGFFIECHTYCDTGHLFKMVISEDPWHLHLMPIVCQWSCHYLSYDIGLSKLGFEHPTLQGERSNPPLRREYLNKVFKMHGWSIFIVCTDRKHGRESENIKTCVSFTFNMPKS